MICDARFSADGTKRFELTRDWLSEHPHDIPPGCICLGDGLMGMKCDALAHARLKVAKTVCWIMLNPSTADAVTDDPTVRKVIGFSQCWGFSKAVVVNLIPTIATDPRELPA